MVAEARAHEEADGWGEQTREDEKKQHDKDQEELIDMGSDDDNNGNESTSPSNRTHVECMLGYTVGLRFNPNHVFMFEPKNEEGDSKTSANTAAEWGGCGVA
ncbi:Uu.00g089700.m01.CDS01 [Anthostomella pinea]|uniref:Uu.00g089700.m01.CDS01 n=1 Tax=Anthostomella pinea TaxID=933095 RepID=A0AAI8YHT3_9PEZI|nr:Uu.00g089700.m01.CDS01 [Anthostomella pinea]